MTDVAQIIADIETWLDKATPGPWYVCGPPWYRTGSGVLCGSPDPHVGYLIADTEGFEGDRSEYEGSLKLGHPDDDASYIAACSPDRIRALLDEVKRLQDTALPARINDQIHAQLAAAEAELARLRAPKWNLGPSDPNVFENRAGSVEDGGSPAGDVGEVAEKLRVNTHAYGICQHAAGGSQPECFAMMDQSVDRLITVEARLREAGEVITAIAEVSGDRAAAGTNETGRLSRINDRARAFLSTLEPTHEAG